MKKKIIFSGVGTALITPFKDGVIDFSSLKRLINTQIECGINALIIGGTTGECATLSDDERYRLFSFAKAEIGGRCPLIFGTGTNDTKAAIRHTMLASQIGCDGILSVTPYYNKGTERGIVKHYLQIAEASTVPVLLYNVPSRTGVNITQSSLEKLSEHENIVGIKEASDSADRLIAIRELSDSLTLYAGNDSATYTVLSLGGEGVISVVSNAYPKQTLEITEAYFKNDLKSSLTAQIKLLPIIRALFCETNPAPIKYVMNRLGFCTGELRLPLDYVTEASQRLIDNEMNRLCAQ